MTDAIWAIRAEDLLVADRVSLSVRTRNQPAIDYEVLAIKGQVYTLSPLSDPHRVLVRRRTTLDRSAGLFLIAPRVRDTPASHLHAQVLLDTHPATRAVRHQYRLIFDSLHAQDHDRLRFQTWSCLSDLSRIFLHPTRQTRQACVETLIQQIGNQAPQDITVARRFAESTTELLAQGLLRA